MLFETTVGRRRLFRKGDPYNLEREGAKTTPEPEDLPSGYGELLKWYQGWCAEAARSQIENILCSGRKGQESISGRMNQRRIRESATR